ncbi:MAG: DUF928 domain-containing protein [Cyanobacteriota bacterium]|nr:DUF928 domain-containing protein [Cyanobacteriota bacterium]
MMNQPNFSSAVTTISATLTGAVLLGAGFVLPVRGASLDESPAMRQSLPVSVEFQSPDNTAPATSIGGGVRGSVRFQTSGESAPRTSVAGGVRGNVGFETSGESAPRTSVGGGVRGDVAFAAPGASAPRNSVAGGVRGDVQFSTPGTSAPRNSVAGGVRGGVEFSTPDESAPRNSASGGVRGGVEFSTPDESAPRTSASGGVRGNELPALTPLLPPTQYGQTVSARPTFYVYVPPTASKQVFFSIQDDRGNPLYHTMLEISGEGGTIGVTLPENGPELAVGTNYLWAFAPIEPDGILRPDNFSVIGWVQRTEASVNIEDPSNPVKVATAYGASGLWYDTLEVLASAQLERPGDETLKGEWNDLLEQVGLESVAAQPIVK